MVIAKDNVVADESDVHIEEDVVGDSNNKTLEVVDPNEADRVSSPFNIAILFFFMFFDTVCSSGAMSMGLLVYIPWGMSLISYANAYLIAFSLNIFTQVIVAFYSDRIVTPIGRRKPFIIVSNALRYISFLCLANPPNKSDSALGPWFTMFYCVYMISNAIGTNPFASWFIESTVDQADYTKIYSVAFPLGGVLGGLLGLGLLEVSPSAASVVAVIGGTFFTGIILFFIPGKIYRESPKVPDMIPSIRICLQSLEFRKIFSIAVMFNAAMGILGSTQLFLYYTCFEIQHMNFINELLLSTALIAGIIGMILNIACNWLFTKIDKIKVYMIITIWVTIFASANFFTTFSRGGMYASMVISSAVAMAYFPVVLIAQLFLRDLVVFDTFCTGCNRENMYLTALNVPSSILSNFIGGIPVVVLTLSGFHSHNSDDDHISSKYTWNAGSVWLIRIFATIVVSALVLKCFFILSDYGLSAKIADQLCDINKRRADEAEADRRREALEAYEKGVDVTTLANMKASTKISSKDNTHDELTDEEKQLLMHFSVIEIRHIIGGGETIESTGKDIPIEMIETSRQRLSYMLSLIYHGICSALVLLCFLITALIFDGRYLKGLFSTLLIYFVLLTCFYIFFEIFRFRSGANLLLWSSTKLYYKSLPIYKEYMKKHETLEERLSKEGMMEYDSVSDGNDDEDDNDDNNDNGAVKNVLHNNNVNNNKSNANVAITIVENEEIKKTSIPPSDGVTGLPEHQHHHKKNGWSLLSMFSIQSLLSVLAINSGELNNTTGLLDHNYRKVFTVFITLGFVSIFVIMLAGIQS